MGDNVLQGTMEIITTSTAPHSPSHGCTSSHGHNKRAERHARWAAKGAESPHPPSPVHSLHLAKLAHKRLKCILQIGHRLVHAWWRRSVRGEGGRTTGLTSDSSGSRSTVVVAIVGTELFRHPRLKVHHLNAVRISFSIRLSSDQIKRSDRRNRKCRRNRRSRSSRSGRGRRTGRRRSR